MTEPTPKLKSILIAIAPAQIALFKSIFESYDNLATLRTEDPVRHYLRIYFGEDQATDVEQLLESLMAKFELRRLPG
ncbi:MAG: DUF4911 domain-containing protein [Candidatus Binataceae bacterium]